MVCLNDVSVSSSFSEYKTVSAANRQVGTGPYSAVTEISALVNQTFSSLPHFIFHTPLDFICVFLFRSNSHLSSAVPPLRVGQLSSHHFLSELSTREKNLRKMLEGKTKCIVCKQDVGDEECKIFSNLWLKMQPGLTIFAFCPTTPVHSQNQSTKRPSSKLSSLTAALLSPIWGLV